MTSPGSSAIVSGERYVTAIEAVESNRRARAAFHEGVLRLAPPGATVFDFGAGPGVDALHYARAGFRVQAFDIDPEMRAAFRNRCAAFIERGTVTLTEGSFAEFLGAPAGEPVDLITANFAPLSMIDDLAALFARFAAMTRPGAKIFASLLNPWSTHDLRYGWWWRHRLEYLRTGEFSLPGPGYRIHRRSARVLARLAAPAFELTRMRRGLPATRVLELPVLRSLAMTTGGFVFAELTRR